jgi:predicted component of type VI protein secretion system
MIRSPAAKAFRMKKSSPSLDSLPKTSSTWAAYSRNHRALASRHQENCLGHLNKRE